MSYSNYVMRLRRALRGLEKDQVERLLKGLNQKQLSLLEKEWIFWARDDQLPPELQAKEKINWRNWLLMGGRGSGKSRAGAEWIRHQALGIKPFADNAKMRIALIGETFHDVRSVMVEGESGLLAIHHPNERPEYISSRKMLLWKNGAMAQCFSAEEPESLRGPQFHIAWCDEFAKWQKAVEVWQMLQFCLRLGDQPKAVITTTPRNRKIVKQLLKDDETFLSVASSFDNQANLPQSFLDNIQNRYGSRRLGRQEIYGELIEHNPNALWQYELIDRHRVDQVPEQKLIKKVIAIDPPASHHKASNACGMVIAGLTEDQHVYILKDASLKQASPLKWGEYAIKQYHQFGLDRLIAEVNQGGNMVETILRQVDPLIAYKSVFARKSKYRRAEPVAALYEQGRVHHVGMMRELEDELCQFDPNKPSQFSPDRMDALVWAVSYLWLDLDFGEPKIWV